MPYISKQLGTYKYPQGFQDFIAEAAPTNPGTVREKGHKKNKITYVDAVATFDTETTSTTINGVKYASLYLWCFNLSGATIYGRSLDTLDSFLYDLAGALQLYPPTDPDTPHRVLPVYVHNLPFDFAFLGHRRAWKSVFSLDTHSPLRALDCSGLEFRDSYALTGLSLDNLQPRSIPVKKLAGSLDYKKQRHHKTLLTATEIAYAVADVQTLAGVIYDKLADFGDNLATIPLTRTGYVRRDVRKRCTASKTYRDIIKGLTLTEEQYKKLKQAFAGGFTHANALYNGITLKSVFSFDLTSSYTSVMCSEKFPMSRFKAVHPNTFKDALKYIQDQNKCSLIELTLTNVKSKEEQDNPISASRCRDLVDAVENNGRVYSAKSLTMTITDVDFAVIDDFYTFDEPIIKFMEVAYADYLPKEIIECVLYYYGKKTTLKNVPGEEVQYSKFKEFVNAIYGMCVTDIIRDDYIYTAAGWDKTEADAAGQIDKYNSSKNRFLYYPWGVWVTAYSRRNLFTAIKELGDDYVYSDTDSVKYLNHDKHKKYFEDYNKDITRKISSVCVHYGIDPASAAPKNKQGTVCPLGVWDFDGFYIRFMTLGAKRYLVEYADDPVNGKKAGTIASTVAGLRKKDKNGHDLVGYLKTLGDPFENFRPGITVPEEYTGKLTHTYIDDGQEFDLTDYTGQTEHIKTAGGVHLAPQSYDLGVSEIYKDFFEFMQYKKIDYLDVL